MISCATCQARKVRCDRKKPSCGWCTRNSRQCSYSKKQKPGPKAGAGQDLADKIYRLESVVQALSQQLESHICGPIAEETAFPSISPPVVSLNSARNNASNAKSSPQAESLRQSQQNRERLDSASNPNDNESRAFTPVTPSSSFSLLGTTVGWPSERVEPDLPPPKQLYVLVDLYFKHVNTWIPMLDRVTTFNILSQQWTPVEADRILLHAIVVIMYSMDRYATLGTGSRFSIEERAAKRRLPCRYDMFSDDRAVETRWPRWDGGHCNSVDDTLQNAASLGSYSYHCELLKIITQTHEFLRKPVQIDFRREIDDWRRRYSELDSWLSTWLCSLPGEYSEVSQFCHSDTKSKISNWIILQAAFVVAVISLHSAAAYPYPPSRLFRPSYNAMQKCLGAVSSLKELTVDVVNTGMLDLLGPGFPFALWVASRMLLVHASIKGHTLDNNILFFMDTLSQLGRYWPIARTYRERLNSALQEHGEHSATGIFQRPSMTEKLDDMRR
ncbi:hypothetical protein BUE80_DR006117 [Diplocarpon rosae]|nr:hypothetical protein BUE80_DR006117 [Diplocarpon rosae]